MSVVIRLKVPIEMHYTVIPMGTSKVNSSPFSGHYNRQTSVTYQLGCMLVKNYYADAV